jgi:CheY-like chemotaxis protein
VNRPAGDPAVVMLDVKMPKVDGIEVLRQVKTDDVLRQVPVVMLTSSREELDVMQSYREGANAYVVKPAQLQEFINAVKELGLFWAVINEPPPGSNGRQGLGGIA